MVEASESPQNNFTVLVTGANSGLGLDICRRLIDEFLYTRPRTQRLVLIITTRDTRKAEATIALLSKHLRATILAADRSLPGVAEHLAERVEVAYELLDLTNLKSVYAAAERLKSRFRAIDVAILNAGLGGWLGIDWLMAAWYILTDTVQAMTWPKMKLSAVGLLARRQIGTDSNSAGPQTDASREPPLGEVFCANVFGHYIFTHALMSTLRRSREDGGARIVWLSSLEAYAKALSLDDLQGIKSPLAYEASKRLTDLLVLTSNLPEAGPWTQQYFAEEGKAEGVRPRLYVSHPGICMTNIMPLSLILIWLNAAVFYVVRWLGSIWHTIDAYKGACAPVWLALTPRKALDGLEKEGGGAGKWGSATDQRGNERVERTEVEGWGYGGVVGDARLPARKGRERRRKGRMREALDSTRESKEEFVGAGRECWREMERLRLEWEGLLGVAGR